MAPDDWYLRFREENQRQLTEQRQETEQWSGSWDKTMEAISQKIDSSLEELTELIRSMNERWPAATINGDGARSGSGSTTVIDQGDRSVEVEGIAEPSQETEIEGSSRNFDAHGSEFSVDDLRDRKVEFESVQMGSQEQEIAHSNPINVLHIGSYDLDTTSVDLSEGECSDPTIAWGIGIRRGQESKFSSSPQLEVDAPWQALQIQFEYSTVISNFPNLGRIIVASSENFVVEDVHLANRMNYEKLRIVIGVKFVEFPEISNARKVFVKRPRKSVRLVTDGSVELKHTAFTWPYDRGKGMLLACPSSFLIDPCTEGAAVKLLIGCVESPLVIVGGIVRQKVLNNNLNFDHRMANLESDLSSSKSLKGTYGYRVFDPGVGN